MPNGRLKITIPSLGILYIAAVLEKENYRVKVLDAPLEGFHNETRISNRNIRYGLSYTEIKKIIREFSPELVGITCQSALQFNNAVETCRAVKEEDPLIVTVLGGPHPSTFPVETLKSKKEVDFVIIGEGEYPFRDLLKELNCNAPDFKNIDGLVYRQNSEVRLNPKKHLIENLDELPFPARHLVPIDKYFKINLNQNLSFIKRALTMVTSRGCPHRCIFCFGTNFWMNKYRCRSPENVLSEIDHLVKVYKIKEIQFTDDSLTSNYRRALKIFELLKDRDYNIKWSTPNGLNVSTLDERLMRAMKESGCYEVRFAIESGNEQVLKEIIKKPINLDIVRENMQIAKRLNLITSTFFSLGYPGETKKQIKDTFSFIRQIKPDSVFLSIATPLPGTDLMNICLEKGYVKKEHNFLESEFSTATYDTEHFTRRELEEFYFKEALLLNISLITRNMRAFLARWGALLWYHPIFAFKVVFNYFMRTKRKGAYLEN